MSIITCPECHEQVSTLAAACLHCGAPAAKTSELPNSTKAETIEQPTPPPISENVNKKVALKMVGLVLILIGIGIVIYQIVTYNPSPIELSQGNSAVKHFWLAPSIIMILTGGALWRAGS